MVKNALKNFFKNILDLFVPMGIVYLFFLIACFVAFGSVVNIASDLLSQVFELIHYSVGESSASVNDFLSYAFGQLNWNGNLIEMIVHAFRTHWLSETVIGFLKTLNASTEGFSEQFTAIMGDFSTKLHALISVVATLCVVGVVAANYITRIVIRRRTAKRGLKKFIVAHTVVPVVQAVFVVASVVVLAFLRYYGILVIAALLVISGAFSLTSSWVIHRTDGLRLKDVVTFRNIMLQFAAAGLIMLIDAAIAVGLFLINSLLAILIMIPLVLYSLNIIGVNTDSIVCTMIAEKERAAGQADALPAGTEKNAEEESAAPAEAEKNADEGSAAEGDAAETLADGGDAAPADGIAATESAEEPAEGDLGDPAPDEAGAE